MAKHKSDVTRGKPLLPEEIPVGVVGLGLMGTSITACLLATGHRVIGIEKAPNARRLVRGRLKRFLEQSREQKLLRTAAGPMLERFSVSGDFNELRGAHLVIESVTEDFAAKKEALRRIEQVIARNAVIGTNTSGIPVALLQKGTTHPERILGIHWAEPAHVTRFMEIVCGPSTQMRYAQKVVTLAQEWGKEPSLLKRDIRGFITNRCFYALLREAFYLVEAGYATVADVDRSLRNDLGYWITFAGPFRFMDITGVPAYGEVMKGLFPELSCQKGVPHLMRRVVRSGAQGISNARGFYPYSRLESRKWHEKFLQFSYEIRALAEKYASLHEERVATRKKR
jgi:3-hydroxybutyryl-CoA dehydrogenase